MMSGVGREVMAARFVTTSLLCLVLMTSGLAGCFADEDNQSNNLDANFSFSPDKNIKVDDDIEFNASESLPQDGTLTYRWDFNGDGAVDDTGKTATWSYSIDGSYNVTLTITDGIKESQKTEQLTILGADAAVPTADAGTDWAEEDCDGEDGSNPTNGQISERYLIYICEDKGDEDRTISATTNVNLDASSSTAGGESYLTQWSWDLDAMTDSDGDGIADNDDEANGQTFEWKNIAPGEYILSLTVTNSEGLNDSMTFKVFVNYVGIWKDFNQDGSQAAGSSGSPGETWFEYNVIYDDEVGNTIVRAEYWLTYPKKDDDWVTSGGDNNNNTLDIYIFNESGDEVWNTSAPTTNRSAGDCSEDNDCMQVSISRSQMRPDRKGDGEWTVKIHNDRYNDTQVVEFRILLTYK